MNPADLTERAQSVRPQLRPDIRLGPALSTPTSTLHYLKDERTGWYFQLGEREFFIVSRLDGTRTLDDVGREYVQRFGRRLGPDNWRQIMGLLFTRRLLVGPEDAAAMAARAAAAAAGRSAGGGLLKYRLRLINPDALLSRWEPRLRWVFSPYFVVPVLAAVLALIGVVAVDPARLFLDSRAGWTDPAVLLPALATAWLGLFLHEAAHGLTCKHFGGEVPEIGVLWRFPLLAPYCKVDDVVLFPQRRHRVYTAFAGIFVNLAMVLPFAVLWLACPLNSGWREFGAEVVLLCGASGLLNLVPFLQLDGYFIVNHALGAANLRTDSYRFCRAVATRLLGRPSPELRAISARKRWTYGLYGLASVAYGCWLFYRFLWYAYYVAQDAARSTGVLVTFVAFVGLLLLLGGLDRRRRRAAVAGMDVPASAVRGEAHDQRP